MCGHSNPVCWQWKKAKFPDPEFDLHQPVHKVYELRGQVAAPDCTVPLQIGAL